MRSKLSAGGLTADTFNDRASKIGKKTRILVVREVVGRPFRPVSGLQVQFRYLGEDRQCACLLQGDPGLVRPAILG